MPPGGARRGPAVLALAAALAAGAAHAEETDADARARAFFDSGKEAMAVGRFADAKTAFERSLALVPRASPAFNLAVALRGMGRPKEASDLLRELLAGKYGELPGERRRDVEVLLQETARDVSTLAVVASGAPSVEVRVDGVLAGAAQDGETLRVRVNPGEHVVTLSARLRETAERRLVVPAGKSADVRARLSLSREARRATLVVVAQKPDDVVEIVGVARARGRLERKLDPGPYELRITSGSATRTSRLVLSPATEHRIVMDSPRPSLLSSPWFWAVAGGVAVAATAGGYALFRPGDPEPVRDSEFQVVETLTRGRR